MAERVGKEVEKFAERLDPWHTHGNEAERAKYQTTVKMIGKFRDVAEREGSPQALGGQGGLPLERRNLALLRLLTTTTAATVKPEDAGQSEHLDIKVTDNNDEAATAAVSPLAPQTCSRSQRALAKEDDVGMRHSSIDDRSHQRLSAAKADVIASYWPTAAPVELRGSNM
ncbi:hypothetical protein BKA63DRAFT_549338 [Paraphoma chrysanthemicola]|nr:hypothetical protein BKA63DRAFT_549338 [Paraphoma chrysanthemicola]